MRAALMDIMKKSLAILIYKQLEREEVTPHWSVRQVMQWRYLSDARKLPAAPCHLFRSCCDRKNWLHEQQRHYTHGFKTNQLLMLQGACHKFKFHPQVLNVACAQRAQAAFATTASVGKGAVRSDGVSPSTWLVGMAEAGQIKC